MASKQVQDLLVRLRIDGLEGLDSLKGAFRELAKTIGPTEQTIERARQSIIEFGEAGNKSEQLIKGQIEAFKGLRSQATQGGKVYKELTANIKELEGAAYGASAAVEAQRKALTALGLSANATASQIEQTINSLTNLRGEVRVDSQAFDNFGKSIAELTNRFRAVNQEAQNFAQAQQRIARPIGATSAAAKQQIRDLDLVTESLREQRDALGELEGGARIRAGAAALAERGAPAAGRRPFEEAVAESLFGGDIKKLLPAKDIKAALDEVAAQIANFQQQIETKLSRKIQISFQETARAGRESARAMAAAFSDPELINVFNQFDKRLGELPDTTTGLNQELSELSQRLANTKRNTVDYLVIAMQMAGVQRELTAVTQGYAQSLLMGIRTGTTEPSARNLREAITALRAEMDQLDVTTSEGARAYAENAREARALENRLKGLADAYRHVGDMAAQAATAETSAATARITANYLNRPLIRQQEQAMAELGQRVRAGVAATPLALPAAGQTTAPGTGLEISGGARAGRPSPGVLRFFTRFEVGDAQLQMPGAPQAFGPQATEQQSDRARRAAISEAEAVRTAAEARQQAEQQIQSYRAEIDKARRADIGSIDSTQRLREAIGQYRSTLPGASAEFKKLTKELGELDARSEKLGRGLTRRRMSGMQVAQAAGAAVSGGIFGGPEGFLGGALGGVFGGVGGAFAGAAAGAQVGALRQQLGGFADYAAQIQKMEIALRNAAGSQDQFNQAVAAANSAVRNLNVPQDVAIQGMTKLTAAVKGAGGQVSDAELVFKNVTSAIKATGGSAQDVDGAITAMVQVFSKGKVSAEELSGQLGERLPGAVTKFAEANEMTLPELQKALEQGQVGLNELMNFIVQLGDEYAGVAGQIASSSQDAGARLTVAFNDMRIAIGETLQPVGAQFQEAFADFIVNITPGLVAAAKAVGDGIKFIINNASQIGAVVEFAAKLAGVTLALKALQAMQGPIGALFLALQSGFQATSAQAVVAQGKIIAFGTAVKTIAASLAAPIVVTFAIVGAQLVIQWLQRIKKARQDLIDLRKDATGEEWFTNIGGKALPENQLKKAINEVGQAYAEAADNVIRLRKERDALEAKGPTQLGSAAIATAARLTEVKAALAAEEQRAKLLSSRYQAGIRNLPNAPRGAQGTVLTQFPDLAGDGANGKADKEADKAAREAQRLYEENLRNAMRLQDVGLRTLQLEELTTLERQRQELVRRDADRIEFAILDLKQKQLGIDIKQTHLNETRERMEDLRVQGLKQGLDVSKTAEEISRNQIEYKELQLEAEKTITEELQLQLQILESMGLTSQMRQAGRRAGLGVFEFGQAGGGGFGGEQLYQPQEFMTPAAQRFQEMREQLKEMISLENQVYAGAMQIGEAFSSAFTETITGSKSAKQALADLMASIGKHFLDMAQQIITQQISMILYGTVMRALGLLGGSTAPNYSSIFSTGQAGFNPSVFTGPSLLNAKGNVYAANGIQPFAMGGIVTKPTFFKFANGGTMSNGVMGEAGPEAIMPLKRGADGKLGVAARLDGAIKRYRSTPGSAAATAEGDSAAMAAAGAATMEPIDVRYSVERINNVDYVTADQFQAGMAQAAQQGAIQGERRAMRTLTNSAAARGRLRI